MIPRAERKAVAKGLCSLAHALKDCADELRPDDPGEFMRRLRQLTKASFRHEGELANEFESAPGVDRR